MSIHNNALRVLIFGMTKNPGGMESVVINYYRHIDDKQIHFDFLTNEPCIAYEGEILKRHSIIYKITARSKSFFKYKKDLKNFFKSNAGKYDAIWVNTCSLANIDYLKMAKRYGIRCRIIHCHNSQNGDPLLRRALHAVNRLRISHYATDYWSCDSSANRWFFGKRNANTKTIHIINNAIDPDLYKFNEQTRREYRKNLGLEGKFVIGNVGRFHFQKNHLFLLDIFREILNKEKNALLVLVGQGGEEQKIRAKIRSLDLTDNVMILQNRSDIPQLLCAFDAFLFPSAFEGFGLALLEAESTNLPSIASSDVIPERAVVGSRTTLVSLNAGAHEWADAVIHYKTLSRRPTDNSFIAKNALSISEESAKLLALFSDAIKKGLQK